MVDISEKNTEKYSEPDARLIFQETRSWRKIIELALSEIIKNAQLRELLTSYSNKPVSEELAYEFLQDSSEAVDDISHFRERHNNLFQVVSGSPIINDELSEKHLHFFATRVFDIRHALVSTKDQDLALKRYIFARDVKMIALAAEILEDQELVDSSQASDIVLPSGVKIHINTENEDFRRDFLDPALWETRNQIKDRVYELRINGKKYILKERKTRFHYDTIRSGHEDGNSSEHEFKTAKSLNEEACYEDDDVKRSWEKPLAYVTFPDGFQFTVFEFEKDLISVSDMLSELKYEIIANREYYEEEYQVTKERALKYYEDETLFYETFGAERTAIREGNVPDITFEDFADTKSSFLYHRVSRKGGEVFTKNGFGGFERDSKYRVHVGEDNRVKLEQLVFDLEYTTEASPEKVDKSPDPPEDNVGHTWYRSIEYGVENMPRKALSYAMIDEGGHFNIEICKQLHETTEEMNMRLKEIEPQRSLWGKSTQNLSYFLGKKYRQLGRKKRRLLKRLNIG